MFEYSEEGTSCDEFKTRLKNLLGNAVELHHINNFIIAINQNDANRTTINLKRVFQRLKKSFEKDNNALNFKEIFREEVQYVLEDSLQLDTLSIYRSLSKFIDRYSAAHDSDEVLSKELTQLVVLLYGKINSFIKDPPMYKKAILTYTKIFRNKEFRTYLLRIIKNLLILHERELFGKSDTAAKDDSYEAEVKHLAANKKQQDMFKKIQSMYCETGAVEISLNLLRDGVPDHRVYEAVEVLILLLNGGNKFAQ